MSEVEMPPNMSGAAGNNKKKKKDKAAVQQVTPQPQAPTPADVSFLDEITKSSDSVDHKRSSLDSSKLDPEDVMKDLSLLKDISIIDAPSPPRQVKPDNESLSVPCAPPRSLKKQQCLKSSPCPVNPVSPISCSPLSLNRPNRERTPSINYNRGQVVKPIPVQESTVASTFAELVHNALPTQTSSGASEKVDWVQFHTLARAGDDSKRMDVLVLGLIRGFQVWTVLENGDVEEVMSERQGPLKHFLPLPYSAAINNQNEDCSPLVALVDASSPLPDRQFCTVSIVSLSQKKVIRLATTPYEEPVTAVQASEKFLVVALSSRVVVYNISSLSSDPLYSIKVSTPADGSAPAFALNGQLLAYADQKLNADVQSCGGLDPDGDEIPATVASQAMSMMKTFTRTITSLGESVTGSTGSKSRGIPQGIMSIANLVDYHPSESIVAHWVAHSDKVSSCMWSPDGRIIVTADLNCTCFNVFLVMPHPQMSSLGAVQHLYRLHRGNTAAKLVSHAFSLDCRWLALATNHGTCHVFAICPYGGKPTARTHADHFTNKESKFMRSAGLVEVSEMRTSNSRTRMHSGQTAFNKDHPFAKNRILARSSGNPRIGPHPEPVLLTAVMKIRDPTLSADNFSAWANDLTPTALAASGKRRYVDSPRISLVFSNRYNNNQRGETLLIARAETGLVEYELRPTNPNNQYSEDPPTLDVNAKSLWTVQRNKNNADIPPPLQPGSPMIVWASKEKSMHPTHGEEQWVPQVEMTTYSGPARRLWMGPQFNFFVYNEETSAELMTPSESRSQIKSIPIVMGDRTSVREDTSIGEATRIECGSWASQASIQMLETPDITAKIADAMREDFDQPSEDYVDAPSNNGSEDDLVQFDDI